MYRTIGNPKGCDFAVAFFCLLFLAKQEKWVAVGLPRPTAHKIIQNSIYETTSNNIRVGTKTVPTLQIQILHKQKRRALFSNSAFQTTSKLIKQNQQNLTPPKPARFWTCASKVNLHPMMLVPMSELLCGRRALHAASWQWSDHHH